MFRTLSICLAAAAALVVASCSSNSSPARKTCYPVKGQLFVSGRPAAGAMVVLHPEGGAPEDWPDGYPRAQVRSDGTFDVEMYGDKDGAPAGDYKVLISWSQGAGSEESEDTQMIDRLKGRYNDPASATVKATVNAAPTELAPIRLP